MEEHGDVTKSSTLERSMKLHVQRLWGIDKQMHCAMLAEHIHIRSSFTHFTQTYPIVHGTNWLEAESSFAYFEDSKRSKTQTGLVVLGIIQGLSLCKQLQNYQNTSNTPFSMEKETAHVSNSISCCLISPKTRPTLSCKIWQIFNLEITSLRCVAMSFRFRILIPVAKTKTPWNLRFSTVHNLVPALLRPWVEADRQDVNWQTHVSWLRNP